MIRFDITVPAKPGWHEPPRLLYDCEFVYVQKGEFQLRIEEGEWTLRNGDVAIIGPFIDHESWTQANQRVVRQCLHFDWNRSHSHINSPLFCPAENIYEAKYMHPVDSSFSSCLRLVSRYQENLPIIPVIKDAFARLARGDAIGGNLLYPVLHFFLQKQSGNPMERSRSKSDRMVSEVKNYIDTHYADSLSLADLARQVEVTPNHLCQSFRQCIGMPPMHYLNQLRLEHACRLLRNSDLRVGEIGRAVGFPNHNYFARFFKRQKGMSPGIYGRRMHQA